MSGTLEEEPFWGETHSGHYLVTCATHGLHRLVDTEAHARNLYALHRRKDHDDDTNLVAVNLTAAGQELVTLWEQHPGKLAEGALSLWKQMTGITDPDDALDYARQIAAADPPLTAVIPPF